MPRAAQKKAPKLDKAAALISEDPKVRAAARWPSMAAWKREFLENWRTSHDRAASLSSAGKRVLDLDTALETDERFFNAYSEVQREITVALEDAQVKSAMTGKNSGAQKLALEAFSDRYRKQPNAAKRGGAAHGRRGSGVKDWSSRAEKKWGDIFESTRSEARNVAAADS